MKKILRSLVLLVLSLFITTLVLAAPQFEGELLPRGTEPLLEKVDIPAYNGHGYFSNINGETYIVGLGVEKYTFPQKREDHIVFPDLSPNIADYIWTGQYYMVRYSGMDVVGGYSYNVKPTPIRFYNADFKLIAEYTFDYNASAIAYYDNTYYCKLFVNAQTMKSTNMTNWQETDEPMPCTIGNITFSENEVALTDGGMTSITYEDNENLELYSSLGDWILKKDSKKNYYLSNDNVYFVKIEYPQSQREEDEIFGLKYSFKCIYEYGDNIVLDLMRNSDYNVEGTQEFVDSTKQRLKQDVGKILRLTVPKNNIYAELEQQKSAPYIKLYGNILGFEQAPVVEQDRTLVPMRFLFEQMGAAVAWDESTETATVTKDGEQISFQIDSPAAKVDSEIKLMDVPAKLVNDKTMVPLRFLSENLGYNVQWDEATKMVTITE